MIANESERQDAAMDALGALQGLVEQKSVPDWSVDFLIARINRLRRAYGMPVWVPAKEDA